jgi:hypothetical protein
VFDTCDPIQGACIATHRNMTEPTVGSRRSQRTSLDSHPLRDRLRDKGKAWIQMRARS